MDRNAALTTLISPCNRSPWGPLANDELKARYKNTWLVGGAMPGSSRRQWSLDQVVGMRVYSDLVPLGISSIGGSIPLLRSQSRKAKPVPADHALHSCNGTCGKSSSSSPSVIVPLA